MMPQLNAKSKEQYVNQKSMIHRHSIEFLRMSTVLYFLRNYRKEYFQAFNVSNGDIFTLRSLWKHFAQYFGLEVEVPSGGPMDLEEFMKDKETVWNDIVEKHGLKVSIQTINQVLYYIHTYLPTYIHTSKNYRK